MTTGKAFWGLSFWVVMHHVALDILNPSDYTVLLQCIAKLLPCDKCKAHFVNNMREYPVSQYMHNNDALFYYTYMLHDLVNKSKNPPVQSPKYENVQQHYKHMSISIYEKNMWHVLFTLAALVKDNTALDFKLMFLFLINTMSGKHPEYNAFLKKYPMDSYLRNNKDTFFYTFLFYSDIYKKKGVAPPPYLKVKASYFAGVGEECRDCKI